MTAKRNESKLISVICVLVIIVCSLSFCLYFGDYYRSEKTVDDIQLEYSNLIIEEAENGYMIKNGGTSLLIFYPGALVESKSYLSLLSKIASSGYDCYLVTMPLNFAIFGIDKAMDIIASTDYDNYFIAGHSLGGVEAASFIIRDGRKINGLILLAAYSVDKIEIPTLLIYGDNDGVLNMDSYNKYYSNIVNSEEHIIVGGNHAGFGTYGKQKRDNCASISNDEQQLQTANYITEFINKTLAI